MSKSISTVPDSQLKTLLSRSSSVIGRWISDADPSDPLEVNYSLYENFEEDWRSYLNSNATSKNVGRGLLRATFQFFATMFTCFKKTYQLHTEDDNFILTLTALKRLSTVKKAYTNDLTDYQNESRSCVLEFNQYDLLLLAYMPQDQNKL